MLSDMRSDDTPPRIEQLFSSTNWKWERRMVRRSAEGIGQRGAAAPSRRLETRDPAKPINIEVTYIGGPTARYRIRARGRTWHFSGVLAFHDVMQTINRTLGPKEH